MDPRNTHQRNIKKLFCFSQTEWDEIEQYRFNERFETQSEAVRTLIKLGLQYHKLKTNMSINDIIMQQKLKLDKKEFKKT
jgi:hypothetical protein